MYDVTSFSSENERRHLSGVFLGTGSDINHCTLREINSEANSSKCKKHQPLRHQSGEIAANQPTKLPPDSGVGHRGH